MTTGNRDTMAMANLNRTGQTEPGRTIRGGQRRLAWSLLLAGISALALSGCGTSLGGFLPSSGPGRAVITDPDESLPAGINVVDLDDASARALASAEQRVLFSDVFTASPRRTQIIGAGDVVEVSLWEAPPATLFGSAPDNSRGGAINTTRTNAFPEQMVSSEGTISIPFAGVISAAGHTPREVEDAIIRQLQGKANHPQVLVRVVRNATTMVTVVGNIGQNTRVPLTARGERLLDIIATAGGPRGPVNKSTVQLTRGTQVHSMALQTIIQDPAQNIPLEPGDVITVLDKPVSFSVLGAVGKNAEIEFEAQGISLTQALARTGGLQEASADIKGIFLFRFEDPRVLNVPNGTPMTPDGKVPLVYRLDMSKPAAFFIAQNFPIHDKDVLYVSTAPGAEFQKFLNMITSVAYPAIGVWSISKQ